MKALVFERSIPRFGASRVASLLGSGRGAQFGPLRLMDLEAPELPGDDWFRVQPVLSGICGSDLATLDGRSSRYFEGLVSFPFVPGHEVVGTVGEGAVSASGKALAPGARVVIEPVLGCLARNIDPPCAACQEGRTGDCELVAFGHLQPGLQTGFCHDTGGGWSTAGLVAHRSQLHEVLDALSDEDAVTVEPLACAIHAVLSAGLLDDMTVAVIGAGTLGLAVTGAVAYLASSKRNASPKALLVGARYKHQRATAIELGATSAYPSDQLAGAVRQTSRSLAVGSPSKGRLTGGADIVFDCVGSAQSIDQSLAMVRPRGKVVLVGMPGKVRVDLAPLWHREVSLVGAYAYGIESVQKAKGREALRTFDLAMEMAVALGSGRLVSATYPIDRFEDAVAHAGAAGRRGAVKIAFDLQASTKKRSRTESER